MGEGAPDMLAPWLELRQGGRLETHFQPIVSLRDGATVAYEALTRASDRSGAPIAADALFRAALAAGRQVEADIHALRSAFRRARGALPAGSLLFVNVSLATVIRYGARTPPAGLAPWLVVELTEREEVGEEQEARLQAAVRALRAAGYRVAMDDCGAGYSGLRRLVGLRPDYAKIDMSLVRGIDADAAKAALVQAMARFAERAGIRLIAEGVETESERDTLYELGVTMAQGFLFGRPAPTFAPARRAAATAAGHDPDPGPEAALAAVLHLCATASADLARGVHLDDAIVLACQRAIAADACLIRRLEDGMLVPTASIGSQPPGVVALGDVAISAHAARDRAVRWCQDAALEYGVTDPRYASAVAAPIVTDGRLWGVLAAGYSEPQRVRSRAVDLVAGLAALAGVILQASESGPDAPPRPAPSR
jgi:EAL domain-containing protein (putative c-di-GMP-specific phosphodiesterase class I)